MALSYVGYNSAASSSATLPVFTAGDFAVVFAYRDGSNTAPSLPGGWDSITFSGANSNSARIGSRTLLSTDTTTGVWTNATEVQVVVLRGQHTLNPIGTWLGTGANSNQLSYPTFALYDAGSANWVVGMAGHRSATDVNAKAVTGMVTRSGATTTLGAHTAAGVTTTFPASNYTTTVNASSGWRSFAVEIRAAAVTTTGTARVSLQAGQIPPTRAGHTITIRARKTNAAHTGTVRVQLYEGATARGPELETSALTTSLADYTLAIATADATTIGSYADLELRIRGQSAIGNPLVVEVARVSLSLPAPTFGTKYGASITALTAGFVTTGSVIAGGAKATAWTQLSVAPGLTPHVRATHQIVVRARTTGAAGKIRAQLFEGATPRSAELESSALTGSYANYTLNIADADAATITDYSNLELRIRGYASTGTATVFQVAEVSLVLPFSTTGGVVFGQAVLSSIATVVADTRPGIDIVYPGAAVYPHNLVSVTAVAAVTAVFGAGAVRGAVVMPLTINRVTSGYGPSGNTGKILLASVATVAAAAISPRVGKAILASVATVSVGGGAQAAIGQVVVSATATLAVAGVSSGEILPPGYTDLLSDMPDLLLAIAFPSPPLDPLQNYTGVSPFGREAGAKRGRQFELDRVEAGQASVLLSNLDGRFNPENTTSPYYPNIKPTRRFQWRMRWSGSNYDIFNGFLEGYPQEFPHLGYDRVVSQNAVDFFMALAVSKFIPGSTVLTTTMDANIPGGEETIGVGGTALPMPQAVPFAITIDNETLTVTDIGPKTTQSGIYVPQLSYRVLRLAGAPAHTVGTAVKTTVVSFGQELTGQRILNVLDHVNLPAGAAIDAGQSLLAPSEDVGSQSPIEHLQLVTEVEGGRLFAAAGGTLTFHGRHRFYANEKTNRATFGDIGTSAEVPYTDVKVTHDDTKIYNIIRITPASGNTVEVRDQASINDHFERPLEKQWPLASDNEAKDAADWLLSRLSRMQARIPELTVTGRSNPTLMWPLVLALELGQRFGFKLRPKDGSQIIDKTLVVEGVEHALGLEDMRSRVQLSLADTLHYWQLGVAGYSELGDTTRLIY